MNYPGCDVFVDSRLEYAATWQSAAANSRLSHRNFIDRSAIIRCYDPIGISSPRKREGSLSRFLAASVFQHLQSLTDDDANRADSRGAWPAPLCDVFPYRGHQPRRRL